GAICDYAANSMLIGSGLNTTGPLNAPIYGPNWVNGPPSNWTSYHRRLNKIKDGTSNTIMVGSRAIATQVYGTRGCSKFQMSNGTNQTCNDDSIAQPGPGIFGTLRAIGPDDVWWTAGDPGPMNANDPLATDIPGCTYRLAPGWTWFKFTFEIIRDAP